MSEADAAATRTATTKPQARGLRDASMAALVAGVVVLALMIAQPFLARLAQQSIGTAGGAVPAWFSAPFGVLGFVVAFRRPRNPLGWIILGMAGLLALSEDASFYVVASYRLRHGGLPVPWAALLAQPTWSVGLVLVGLAIMLFPDGRLPSPRLRWVLWLYLAVSAMWVAGAFVFTVSAIVSHNVQVDSSGNLLTFDNPTGAAAWWGVVQRVFSLAWVVSWVVSLGGQAVSYRRSSGERRQQLKWLMTGSVACLAGVVLSVLLPAHGFWHVVAHLSLAGVFVLPLTMGVAVMKYRLFDIDRVISRTLAYAIVTGLLVGVYAGLVLLATEVFRFKGPVSVAAATLAAAALFSPVRRRVQKAVDRRFNRAGYDAGRTVAAFAARLKDAVELDAIREDLAGVVQMALEPAHLQVWTSPRD